MKAIDLIDNIKSKNMIQSKNIFESLMAIIATRKLLEAKKHTAARMEVNEEDEEQLDEAMPPGVIKAKQRLADLSDQELARKYGHKSEQELRDMAALHGYGWDKKTKKGSDHYVKRVKLGMSQNTNPAWQQLYETPISEARIKIIKARIRGGKIQRRKRVSNVAGYTLRGGKLKRMSMTERRKRRMGQRRGKLKRRAKLGRALMKRKRSLRRRKAMGL